MQSLGSYGAGRDKDARVSYSAREAEGTTLHGRPRVQVRRPRGHSQQGWDGTRMTAVCVQDEEQTKRDSRLGFLRSRGPLGTRRKHDPVLST